MPIAWDGFKATYKYQDTIYQIEVIKGKTDTITLDGKKLISSEITLKNDKKTHDIVMHIK